MYLVLQQQRLNLALLRRRKPQFFLQVTQARCTASSRDRNWWKGFGFTGSEVCLGAADCVLGALIRVNEISPFARVSCCGSQAQLISYTHCKMQRKGDLKKLSQFLEGESTIKRLFIGVKRSQVLQLNLSF